LSTPVEETTSESAELNESRELVRGAAKWLIAGLGAIGAVLVAGSQLSSIGRLSPSDARFWIALLGVALGLLSVMWAMWRVVDLLSPTRWAFEDVVAAWERVPATASETRWWSRREARSVGRYLRDHPLLLGDFTSPRAIQTTYVESDPDREGLDDLVDLMDTLLDRAATIELQGRFLNLRVQIAVGVLFGAAGILAFAWAANPPEPPAQPAPSLRNADLVGADLSGTSLRNADLTGADLTNADLEGADVEGAVITEVVWRNTTCPDGTNSDSRAPTTVNGVPVGATCEGHLTPQNSQ
jgi:hypothetical protein